MTRAYRVNLNVLALVALFTGRLLVVTTQALSIAQRRAQIGLLRVIGCTRRQIVALLLAEGAVVGVTGAALGCLLGIGLARVALSAFGGDLGAGFFEGMAPALQVEPWAVAVFATLGVAAAMAGSGGPALEAAHADPARALKIGDDQRAFAALRPIWPGGVAIATGLVLTQLPPVAGLPLFGYAAIAMLLGGTLAMLPGLTRLVASLLPATATGPASLAVSRLRAYPAQAALGVSAGTCVDILLRAVGRSPDASGMGSSTVERSLGSWGRWVPSAGSPDARATARLCTHAAFKSFSRDRDS